ncbi:uncharacterized protein METZ01_LOCUS439784, partial [marine metagenome]
VPCLSTDSNGVKVELQGIGEQLLTVDAVTVGEGQDIEVGIRPEDLYLSETDKGMPIKVEVVEHLGGSTMVYGSNDDHLNICALLPGDLEVIDDSIINLEVNPASIHVFDSDGGAMRRREIPEKHR